MVQEKGTISIHTENIFPIIKKFLYSDNEIFLRELVSNSVDAVQKLKRLSSLGQTTGELGNLKVSVAVDETAKTVTVSDNGIGMTAEEIKKYINQIAFSGATDLAMQKMMRANGICCKSPSLCRDGQKKANLFGVRLVTASGFKPETF
jgi:molecular chaperone HtpG